MFRENINNLVQGEEKKWFTKPAVWIFLFLILISFGFLSYVYLLKPRFELLDIKISDNDVTLYKEVTINSTIRNRGLLGGDYGVVFSLDGETIETETLSFSGKEDKLVSFSLEFTEDDEWGKHNATVNGLLVTFNVDESLPPNVKIGDRVTYTINDATDSYSQSETIIGKTNIKGNDCWKSEVQFSPLLDGLFSGGEFCADEATSFPLYDVLTGSSIRVQRLTEHKLIGRDSIFPYKIGDEFKVETLEAFESVPKGFAPPDVIKTTKRYKVESLEKVKTGVGDIMAFKVLITDDKTGKLLETVWQAPKVKLNLVKLVDNETGYTQTLSSYKFE